MTMVIFSHGQESGPWGVEKSSVWLLLVAKKTCLFAMESLAVPSRCGFYICNGKMGHWSLAQSCVARLLSTLVMRVGLCDEDAVADFCQHI